MYIPNIKEDNFDELILQSESVTLIHFLIPSRDRSKKYSRFLKELATDQNLEFSIGEVDIEKNEDLRRKFNVRLLPTSVFFYQGVVIDKKVGILSLDDINEVIDKVIRNA